LDFKKPREPQSTAHYQPVTGTASRGA
jgi:hypothetical protein